MEAPGADLSSGAPAALLDAAAGVWTQAARVVTVSDFHRDVAATLAAMGIPCVTPRPTYMSRHSRMSLSMRSEKWLCTHGGSCQTSELRVCGRLSGADSGLDRAVLCLDMRLAPESKAKSCLSRLERALTHVMTCNRHEMEALTEDGAFSVDILLRREGIAVEVTHDIPSRKLTACRICRPATLYTSSQRCGTNALRKPRP